MSESDAANHATVVLGAQSDTPNPHLGTTSTESTQHEVIGTGLQAGLSSFSFFASGALIPVLPYLFGRKVSWRWWSPPCWSASHWSGPA